jgi:hypothetical protein
VVNVKPDIDHRADDRQGRFQEDPAPRRRSGAEKVARVVSEALHATGLADRFPTVFQVEPATDEVSANLVPA